MLPRCHPKCFEELGPWFSEPSLGRGSRLAAFAGINIAVRDPSNHLKILLRAGASLRSKVLWFHTSPKFRAQGKIKHHQAATQVKRNVTAPKARQIVESFDPRHGGGQEHLSILQPAPKNQSLKEGGCKADPTPVHHTPQKKPPNRLFSLDFPGSELPEDTRTTW